MTYFKATTTTGWYVGGENANAECLNRDECAAAILGTTPDNLRGAIARGALKAARHGRDWWVEPAEVERYRRENRRG